MKLLTDIWYINHQNYWCSYCWVTRVAGWIITLVAKIRSRREFEGSFYWPKTTTTFLLTIWRHWVY